jgi:hypothetical protein
MTLPRSKLGRIILALVAVWVVVSVLFLIVYNSGGSTPGNGQGDPINLQSQ